MAPHHVRPDLRDHFPRAACVAALALMLALNACSGSSLPVGHAKRALDPAGFSQTASGPGWDAAAVAAVEGTNGHDYSGSKLMPVLLVLRSSGPAQPQIILEDVRGIAPDAQYLVYSPDEALRLATTLSGGRKVSNAASGATVGTVLGAALGAGAGTLASLLGSKDSSLIWKGMAVGGAAGALVGTASADYSVPKDEREAIHADISANTWQEDPLAPGSTRMGYLLFPKGLGITSVRITVRDASSVETRTIPIASAKDYDQERARTMRAAKAAAPAPGKTPGPSPVQPQAPVSSADTDTPSPGKAPEQESMDI